MDRYLIGPVKGGLKTDVVPFFTPEDFFTSLQNVLVQDGKIKKRPASVSLDPNNVRSLNSRLRINIGTTDILGNLGATIVPGGTGEVGQQFSVGDDIYTVFATGLSPLKAPLGSAGTFDTATGTVTILGADPATDVYWYPCYPVLGFGTYLKTDGTIEEYVNDTKFIYRYEATGFERVTTTFGLYIGDINFRSNYTQFYSSISGENTLFLVTSNTNVVAYTQTAGSFSAFIKPFSAAANYNIQGATFAVVFQSRLLLFDTRETNGAPAPIISHRNRIRYSAYSDASSTDAWYQPPDSSNRGGFIDLDVGERIVCAEPLDDRLIIFTETSIWQLSYTGNPIEPFAASLIDGTHGSRSPNVVEVDNRLLFANNFGIHVFDGRNIIKISEDIDGLFDGAVDYRFCQIYKDVLNELVYIPISTELNNQYPDNIIIYNYKNNTFSIADEYCTALGERNNKAVGGVLSRIVSPASIMGNHKGYIKTFSLSEFKNDSYQHISSISRITAISVELTIPNHQLNVGDPIRVENSSLANLNRSYQVIIRVSDDVVTIINAFADVVDANYRGDATILNIDPVFLVSKQFNFYMQKGFGTSINKLSFNVNKTNDNGTYRIVGAPNGSSSETNLPAFYLGESLLETEADVFKPEEASQDRVWHTVYFQTRGESVSFCIDNASPELLLDDTLPFQELTINAIMVYAEPSLYI